VSGKPNPTAIGAFVVGAIALLLGATLFFGAKLFSGSSGRFGATAIFTGSVKGLDVGAPVTLRGVKIGEVTDIHVSFDQRTAEFVIPVTMSLSREDLGIAKDLATRANLQVLIDRGLRAQLKTQSLLTGLLYVDLVFKPESPPRYVDFDTEEPQLPTAPTGLEAIMERMSEVDYEHFYAWELKNVRRFERPVAYKHPAGAVIWVTLNDGNVAGGVGAISN